MSMIPDSSVYEDPDYNDDTIKWDILDQLWRYNTSGWGEGIRNYNLSVRPNSTRDTSLNPEIRLMEIEPNKAKWNDFFANHPFGSLFEWIGDEFGFDEPTYLKPLTVSEMGVHHFLWEHGKLAGMGGDATGDGLKQVIPNSYLVVYWLGKAMNIF